MSESKTKRGALTGFDGIKGNMTAKRVKDWNKNPPAGRWRAIKQTKIKYTYVLQTWKYDDNIHIIKHMCPFGMVKFV